MSPALLFGRGALSIDPVGLWLTCGRKSALDKSARALSCLVNRYLLCICGLNEQKNLYDLMFFSDTFSG